MTTNTPHRGVVPLSAAAATARESARAVDGRFGLQHKPEVSIDLAGPAGHVEPPVVALAGGDLRPGDQVLVHDRWMEVERTSYVDPVTFPNPAHNRPGHHVALCSNGYQKAVRDGETIETVQADEHGIPALTKTIRDQIITRGYDSGTPEYADWCDECGDYQGFSVNSEPMDPRQEVCHGCEDRRINGASPNGSWSDGGSYVNEHGVDMTPGQAPSYGHI